ncbi:lipopolysaccharide biosynthesis protein [Clostridium polynesiense]|uniref:lipopolysaccharide biosynthesis protein n=1 Tax=Clostridium polynesiense TaxID=1325933 RepID=UPI00058DF9F2|nr:oligosaccharide flippase family protein [Clostridium polynesiense]
MLGKIIDKYKTIPVQVRASLWFLICTFLQKGISLITTPIFTRILTTSEYGKYSVFNSWLSIITVFVSLNLYSGVYTQGMVKFEGERKQYASSLQGLCLTLVVAWTIIYLIFHDWLNNLFELTTVQMLAMLLMIWTTACFNFWSVEQRIDFKYSKLVLITLLVSIAKPVLGVFLVLNSTDKVTARILGLLLVEVVAYTGLFAVQMYRGRKFCVRKFWKYALLFNLPLLPHYLSTSVLSSADRIMIGYMVGEDAAGIYNLAYSVSLIMTMFNTALIQTVEPWLYKKIKAGEIAGISKIAYPTFIIIAGVNVILIAFAPEIIAIFAPIEYMDAIWVIPPIAMSVFFMFAYTFFAVFEFYFEKTHYITFATVAGAVLNIVLNYHAIRIWGYYAAGYTTLLCYVIYAILHYYFMKKICKEYLNGAEAYNDKILLIITVVFMAIAFAFLITYRDVVVRYLLILVFTTILIVKRKIIVLAIKNLISIKKRTDF